MTDEKPNSQNKHDRQKLPRKKIRITSDSLTKRPPEAVHTQTSQGRDNFHANEGRPRLILTEQDIDNTLGRPRIYIDAHEVPFHKLIEDLLAELDHIDTQLDGVRISQVEHGRNVATQRKEYLANQEAAKQEVDSFYQFIDGLMQSLNESVSDIQEDLLAIPSVPLSRQPPSFRLEIGLAPLKEQLEHFVKHEINRIDKLKQDYQRPPIVVEMPPESWWRKLLRQITAWLR